MRSSAWWSIAPLAYGAMMASFGSAVILPSHCAFQLLLGIDCPACGMSTALMHLMSGNAALATSANLAVVPLAMLLTVSVAKAPFDHWMLDVLLRWTSRVVLLAFTVQFLQQFPLVHLFSVVR